MYYINVSDLAAAAGLNPYATPEEIVAKSQKKCVDPIVDLISTMDLNVLSDLKAQLILSDVHKENTRNNQTPSKIPSSN